MRRRRRGFTIIELIVTIGLTILVMAVLAEAFTVGLNTFRKLKALGDMSDNLRTAAHQIRRDLAADHFEGSRRLCDLDLPSPPPREGFFMIRQFAPSLPEGVDEAGIPSVRAPAADAQTHVLHMTVRLKGNRKEDFFGASVPSTSPLFSRSTTFFNQPPEARHQRIPIYTSQWAEVAYFLQPLSDPATGVRQTANGLPLYSLHRIIRVLVANNQEVNGGPNEIVVPPAEIGNYGGMSCRITQKIVNGAAQGYTHFNSPLDVTDPAKRAFQFNDDPTNPIPVDAANQAKAGVNTLLLTDVVSFDVQVLRPNFGGALPFGSPALNTDFTDLPGWMNGVFDPVPQGYHGLWGVQVTIRVWDLRSQQTRQITLVQDM